MTTHTARCTDLALALVQEEADLQGVDVVLDRERDALVIPAWSTTLTAQAAEWLADCVAPCHCAY